VAEKHPEADVKGIDVSPIQPIWVPPNARFELDDYNLEWQDTEKYDLIHQRERRCWKSRLFPISACFGNPQFVLALEISVAVPESLLS